MFGDDHFGQSEPVDDLGQDQRPGADHVDPAGVDDAVGGALLALCEGFGARPAEALLIGDSPIDVATGAAAGVPVCAVTWGFGSREALAAAAPLYSCHGTAELAQLLRTLTSRRPRQVPQGT